MIEESKEDTSIQKPQSYVNEFFEVTVKKISTHKLENSNLIKINLDIKNISSEKQSFFPGNFKLFDSIFRSYGSTTGYALSNEPNVGIYDCRSFFGESINPELSTNLQICFEVPTDDFKLDTLLIYDVHFMPKIENALFVPLTENSKLTL